MMLKQIFVLRFGYEMTTHAKLNFELISDTKQCIIIFTTEPFELAS